MQPVITPEFVRENIMDKPELNHLLPWTEEFSNTRILMAVNLAIDKYNVNYIPHSSVNIYTFPSQYVLLYGTLAILMETQAALLARNTMEYSDGGVQIPIEERTQLYQSLAQMYGAGFDSGCRSIKLQANIEDGWGELGSEYAWMPLW